MRQRSGSPSLFALLPKVRFILILAALLVTFGMFAPTSVNAQWITATIPTPPNTYTIAVNETTNRIYTTNAAGLTAIDGATNNTVATLGIDPGLTIALINPATNQIYLPDANGSILVVNGATNTVATTISDTQGVGVWSMALNSVTNKIYVGEVAGPITVIDGATNNILAHIPVAPNAESVAVNTVTNKIYTISEYATGLVEVIDGINNTVTNTISVSPYPSALAVNPITNKIYVVSQQSLNVTVIDGATNTVITTVNLADTPMGVIVNPTTNKIYVSLPFSNSVLVIDGASNTAAVSVNVGRWAYGLALNPVANKVYALNVGDNSLTVIDGTTNTPSTINFASVAGLTVNPVTDKMYVTTGNAIAVIDGSTYSTAAIPTGAGPEGLAANPATGKVYVSNDATTGGLAVINEANGSTSQVATGEYAYAVAVNPVTNNIYVPNYGSDTVTVVNGANQITATVPTGYGPDAVAVNPLTNKIYVPNWDSANVTVIDGATNNPVTVPAGAQPYAVAVNPTNNKAYVSNMNGNSVTVIDGSNNSTTLAVGNTPSSVAVNPITNKVYVTNEGSASVSVIDGFNNVSSIPTGIVPVVVGVNPVTNKIYVGNEGDGTVTVIDGVSQQTTTLTLGTRPIGLRVNTAMNQIYITSNLSNIITVIDGATNGMTNFLAGTTPWAMAVDPVTSKAYIGDVGTGSVIAVTPSAVQGIPLIPNVQAVTDSQTISGTAIFATNNASPSFTASVTSSYSPNAPNPLALYYQVDTWQGSWQSATLTSSPLGANPASFSFSLSNVPSGVHTLYVLADNGDFDISPQISNVTGYVFAIMPIATTTTVTADSNPQTVGQTVNITAYIAPVSGTGTPTGTVNFLDGTTIIDTATLDSSAHAQFSTSLLAVGPHTITAVYSGDTSFYGGTSAQLIETINPVVTLSSITLSPTSGNVIIGQTAPFAATGNYSDGSKQNLTTSAAWSSSNTAVATVSAGLVTAVAAGSANISATYNSIASNIAVVTVPAVNPAAMPSFSPFPSNYTAPETVTLSDSSAGVTIYYTLDGSAPSPTNGSAYTAPIKLTATTTIKAMATGGVYGSSAVNSGTYTLQAVTPSLSPFPSSYTAPQTVKLSDTTPGAAIYYTVDGTTPSATNGTLYSGPIALAAASTTIKAVAVGTGLTSSAVAGGTYTLQAVTPSFSPFPSSYTAPQSVKLSDATPGTAIYYTVDGTTPSATNGTLYSGPIVLAAASITIKAVAVGIGFSSSAVAGGTYTLQAMTPGFSPFPSTYTTPQTVKLSDVTPGSAIYYTVDGTTPSATNGTLYSGPIAVTTTTMIKAVAIGTGYNSSTVATGTYTIQ